MKTLYLLRHAKSSWDDPMMADFDRPLNDRGRQAAPFMGDLIASKGFDPSVILCSPAERARETGLLVKTHSGLEAPVLFDERIYEASSQGLRQVISELAESYDSALLVGHNPGVEGLIRLLTGDIEPMPTAALAVLHLRIGNWPELGAGSGSLLAVYRPKEEAKRSAN